MCLQHCQSATAYHIALCRSRDEPGDKTNSEVLRLTPLLEISSFSFNYPYNLVHISSTLPGNCHNIRCCCMPISNPEESIGTKSRDQSFATNFRSEVSEIKLATDYHNSPCLKFRNQCSLLRPGWSSCQLRHNNFLSGSFLEFVLSKLKKTMPAISDIRYQTREECCLTFSIISRQPLILCTLLQMSSFKYVKLQVTSNQCTTLQMTLFQCTTLQM